MDADQRTREIAEYLRTVLNAPWYAQLIEAAFLDGDATELAEAYRVGAAAELETYRMLGQCPFRRKGADGVLRPCTRGDNHSGDCL